MPLDVSRIRAQLAPREVYYFTSTTTTMAEAGRLAAAGAPAGTLILAEEQTAGRGRMGRTWHSEADAGLYLTVILRPTRTAPWLTLAVGLALREVISSIMGDAKRVDIRWPNDVLLDGLKCAGILVTADGDSVLVGVGVNVNHASFPEDLAQQATSLRLALGAECSREQLLVALINRLDAYRMLPAEEIRRCFVEASSYAEGLRVEIETTGKTGVTCGLDQDGYLLLKTGDGRVERIVAGGVRPV